MTVLQKVIKNNFELMEYPNCLCNISQLCKATKKIIYVAKITIIATLSMSLSFYLVFLR